MEKAIPSAAEQRSALFELRLDPSAKQSTSRTWIWWTGLLLAFGLAIGGIHLWQSSTLGQPPLVQVASVQRIGVHEPLSGLAGPVLSGAGYVVTGDRYISLGVRVPGCIVAYSVEEGDFVRKGELLVRLDNRDYRALLRKAEAHLELSRANLTLKRKKFERIQELHEAEVVTDENLDIAEYERAAAQAEVHQAEAEVALAKVNLAHTRLTAPADGVVLAKLKEVGEIAVPGGFSGSGDLIRLANLQDLRCEVDINESDFHWISLGQEADVVPDAYPDRSYPAQVAKIYPQVNRQKGTIKVELKLMERDASLRPDMSVRINFAAQASQASEDNAIPQIVIPKAALQRDSNQTFVWIVRNDHVSQTSVQIGRDFGDTVQVTRGLEGGESLVVSGTDNLREGIQVNKRPSRSPFN